MLADDQPVTRRELREELQNTLQHYATKADLAELETRMVERMAATESRLVKWMVGMVLGGMAAAAAIASAISNFIN